MSFIIMYSYATVIDILQSECHYIICKFWFENGTLIQVGYFHLLDNWCVFIVEMLFSSFFFFFDSAHDKIDIDIYLKIFGCILVLHTHQI